MSIKNVIGTFLVSGIVGLYTYFVLNSMYNLGVQEGKSLAYGECKKLLEDTDNDLRKRYPHLFKEV